MTNVVAAIIVTLSTNWHSIGTFTPHVGRPSEVQEGRIVTNTIAIIHWNGEAKSIVIETAEGPVIAERKFPLPDVVPGPTNVYYFTPNAITNLLRQ